MLAQLTGLPVVPMSAQIHSKKYWAVGMAFMPLPFARCDIRMGEPIWVDRKGDEVEREARRQIQERMMARPPIKVRFSIDRYFSRRALMAVT